MRLVSRFAPAPTGFLHLGHIVNAIYVWGVTRAHGGRVLMRIEDHDRRRCRQEFESAILEDLDWLGLVADRPAVRQSDRVSIYESALDELRERGLVYACDCSRAEISARSGPFGDGLKAVPYRSHPTVPPRSPVGDGLQTVPNSTELRYPGTCAHKHLHEAPGLGVRVRFEASVERFDDWRHGPQEQRPFEQCGDLLARDRDGNWTYQFAAAVDDYRQGITLVIRGDDLLPSTGRQLQLARMLGRTEPASFLHHPLIMKTPTQKLSKSDGDTGVRDMRAKGLSAERVIGQAAALAGLVDRPCSISAREVSALVS